MRTATSIHPSSTGQHPLQQSLILRTPIYRDNHLCVVPHPRDRLARVAEGEVCPRDAPGASVIRVPPTPEGQERPPWATVSIVSSCPQQQQQQHRTFTALRTMMIGLFHW